MTRASIYNWCFPPLTLFLRKQQYIIKCVTHHFNIFAGVTCNHVALCQPCPSWQFKKQRQVARVTLMCNPGKITVIFWCHSRKKCMLSLTKLPLRRGKVYAKRVLVTLSENCLAHGPKIYCFLELQVQWSAGVKNKWQMQVIQVLLQEIWGEGVKVACLIFNQWPYCMNGSYLSQHVCLKIKWILPFHITKSINYYLW